MTDEDARTLKKGSYVMHLHSMPSCRPLRCTEVQETQTGRVMIRVSVLHNAWVPATEYALPKGNWKPDSRGGGWYIETKDERGERHVTPVSDDAARARWAEQMT